MPLNEAAAELAEQNRLTNQHHALALLTSLPVSDAIGAACSYLLHCAYNHPDIFRRVMNERVVREGFSGISLLALFNRVSK
jgi:hypothetical protein